jgi:hypothetical protein
VRLQYEGEAARKRFPLVAETRRPEKFKKIEEKIIKERED